MHIISLRLLAAAVLLMGGSSGTLTAQLPDLGGTPLYNYWYYSDGSYSQIVGGGYDDCNGYHWSGTVTQYEVVEQVGVCRNGVATYW